MSVPALPSGHVYTTRVLPSEEWPVKYAQAQLLQYPQLPNPEHTMMIVVEDPDGVIVASWCAMNTVHLEGLYVSQAYRHVAAVARELMVGMGVALLNVGCREALTIGQDPAIVSLAQKAGFVIIPGTLLKLALTPPVEAPS
jgi:hypothetical protein